MIILNTRLSVRSVASTAINFNNFTFQCRWDALCSAEILMPNGVRLATSAISCHCDGQVQALFLQSPETCHHRHMRVLTNTLLSMNKIQAVDLPGQSSSSDKASKWVYFSYLEKYIMQTIVKGKRLKEIIIIIIIIIFLYEPQWYI